MRSVRVVPGELDLSGDANEVDSTVLEFAGLCLTMDPSDSNLGRNFFTAVRKRGARRGSGALLPAADEIDAWLFVSSRPVSVFDVSRRFGLVSLVVSIGVLGVARPA